MSVETVRYDQQTDILRLLFSDAPIKESDEIEPGLIVDYDASGQIVGVELLDASVYVTVAKGKTEPVTTSGD